MPDKHHIYQKQKKSQPKTHLLCDVKPML